MIGPLMIGDSSAAAAGGRGAGTAGGAGGAALATFSATGGAGGGAGTAEGAGGAKAAPLLNFPATGGAWLGIFPAVGAAAGVEPVTVPATDATPGGFAVGTACAGDGDCSSDMPHMPQKRLVVGFSLPQRGQRTEPPHRNPYTHSLR
jgi:hypothetical protein